jgi:hypothetical protein
MSDSAAERALANPAFTAQQNKAHVPTDQTREEVRRFAKVCDQQQIALLLGVSTDTLQRHYRFELDIGRVESVAAVGSKLLQKALAGHTPEMIFYLKSRGGWSEKVRLANADGDNFAPLDLSALESLTPDELAAAAPILRLLLGGQGTGGPAPRPTDTPLH